MGDIALRSGYLGDFALKVDRRAAKREASSCAISPKGDGCGAAGFGDCQTLAQMVALFLKERADRAERERRWWGEPSLSFERACRRAFFTLEDEFKRDPHQWTMTKVDLLAMSRILAASETSIRQCRSFEELYQTIEKSLGVAPGHKPLLIYDVARRLGFALKLEPKEVYLHCGPRMGAEALRPGLGRGRCRPLADFPTSLRDQLSPAQAEDFLCVARAHLKPELWD